LFIPIFWDRTLCHSVFGYRRFDAIYRTRRQRYFFYGITNLEDADSMLLRNKDLIIIIIHRKRESNV